MNPAQGSAPPEDRAEELDLAPVRRCKSKSVELPFSVESLMSDRTPDSRSLHSPEPGSGSTRAEEECAPLRGPSDREGGPWSQAPYTSPPSECPISAVFYMLWETLKTFEENAQMRKSCQS